MKKYNAVANILPDLAEIFNSFPDSMNAADGSKILIKHKDKNSLAERFRHLVTKADTNNQERNSYALDNKIKWLPRVVETLENAQAKLKDPVSGNFAYVRSYDEGAIHTVIVTKDGVIEDIETYDHGLITQFAEKYTSRRDGFDVVWEKASESQSSTQTVSHAESSKKLSRPLRQLQYTTTSENVKNQSNKNGEKYRGGYLAPSTFIYLHCQQKKNSTAASTE